MKPTLPAMETKCNMGDGSETPRQQRERSSGHSKMMTRVAITAVSMVIMSAIVVGAIFVGAHLTREAQKESWVHVDSDDGQSVRGRITVRQDEEELMIPGQYQALIDFKRSVLFLKDLTDVDGKCYMSTFNRTLIPSPDELRLLMDTDQIQSVVDAPHATLYLTATSAQVSTDVLSPAAQSLCRAVFWALPTGACYGGHLREKRHGDVLINLMMLNMMMGRRGP